MDMKRALLFDFDGVIADTESQYSVFWEEIGKKYLGTDGLCEKVKGCTLKSILEKYFADNVVVELKIRRELSKFENSISYDYIPGVVDFVMLARKSGFRLAVVTSSDIPKMNCVYVKHPEMRLLFDLVLTSEDFSASKPNPDCFLKGMERLGSDKDHTVVFEDSINGLKAAQASGAHVIGLTTTNPPEIVRLYSEFQIPDFNNAETILSTISALCD